MKLDITDEIRLQRTEIVAQKEHQKQHLFIGKVSHVPGLTIWQLHVETGIISEAPMKGAIAFKQVMGKTEQCMTHQIDIQPGHLYTQALNHKNAARKFCKMLGIKFPKS